MTNGIKHAPAGGDIVRERGAPLRHTARKAKVAQLEFLTGGIDQEVLRLDVAMNHIMLVAPVDSFHQLWGRTQK